MPSGIYVRKKVGGMSGKRHSMETKQKMSITRKGKHLSMEHRQKLSEAQKGKHHTEEAKQKMSEARKGIIFSEETKQKMSEAKKGKKLSKEHIEKLSGKNSSNWQGGKSFEPYGIEFNDKLKEQIRERDNYTCQECGIVQLDYKLNVHHMDYNKQNNNSDNLISLCNSCHSQTNFSRDDWMEYFQNKTCLEEITVTTGR